MCNISILLYMFVCVDLGIARGAVLLFSQRRSMYDMSVIAYLI